MSGPMGVGKITNACQCEICQELCHKPCWGTIEDIWGILQAGLGSKLEEDSWRMNSKHDVVILRPKLDGSTGCCVFFRGGGCELHDLGLKPTEGMIAHCSNLAGESGRGVFGKDTAQHWDARSRLAYGWSRMGDRTRRLIMREWEKAIGLRKKKKMGPKKKAKMGLIDQWA